MERSIEVTLKVVLGVVVAVTTKSVFSVVDSGVDIFLVDTTESVVVDVV